MNSIVSAILAVIIKVLKILVEESRGKVLVKDLIPQLEEAVENKNLSTYSPFAFSLISLLQRKVFDFQGHMDTDTAVRPETLPPVKLLPVTEAIEREDQADALIDRLIEEDGPIEKGGALGLLLEWVPDGRRLLCRKLFPLLGHPAGAGVSYEFDQEELEDLVKDFKSILSVGYEAGRVDGRESEIKSAVGKRILAKAEQLCEISRYAADLLKKNNELKGENETLNAENNRLMNVISLHGEAERKEAKQRRVKEIEETYKRANKEAERALRAFRDAEVLACSRYVDAMNEERRSD